MRSLFVALAVWLAAAATAEYLVGQQAPHVVFLVGESEYGSAETMPKFARRLEGELNLRVTYLQSKGKELPSLEVLDSADLLVMFLRFRAEALQVSKAELAVDRRTVTLLIPDLVPTMGIEIACDLETSGGQVLRAKIHGTVHKTR